MRSMLENTCMAPSCTVIDEFERILKKTMKTQSGNILVFFLEKLRKNKENDTKPGVLARDWN